MHNPRSAAFMSTLAEKKTAIFNAVKPIYADYKEIIEAWESVALTTHPIEEETGVMDTRSSSFTMVFMLLDYLIKEHNVDLSDIHTLVDRYERHILHIIEPYIQSDFPNIVKVSPSISVRKNEKLIQSLLKEDITQTGSSVLYHKLREAISMNQFNTDTTNIPTLAINEKTVQAIAQIFPKADRGMQMPEEEIEKWEGMMSEAVTKMDDLTADIFDIVSLLWLQRNHTESTFAGMIEFHSDDALELRQIQKRQNDRGIVNSYLKSDRDEVMKRIAALASIWVKLDDKNGIQFVDKRNPAASKDYQITDLKRLFMIDSVKFAYDKKTGEPIGIYSCKIRPGEILTYYLEGSEKSLGALSLKALQYNPVQQKYHKRLTRYLSWQWRIRQRKSDYERPYKIGGDKGLLSAIGLEPNTRFPTRTKESFENILDTLMADGIIDKWYYVSIDENEIGKRGWLDYWMQLQVIIVPPETFIAYSDEMTTLQANDFDKLAKAMKIGQPIKESKELIEDKTSIQMSFSLDNTNKPQNSDDLKITPEVIKTTRRKRGLSISLAAKQLEISHSTLSRFERGLITKPNKENLEKMKEWLSN